MKDYTLEFKPAGDSPSKNIYLANKIVIKHPVSRNTELLALLHHRISCSQKVVDTSLSPELRTPIKLSVLCALLLVIIIKWMQVHCIFQKTWSYFSETATIFFSAMSQGRPGSSL